MNEDEKEEKLHHEYDDPVAFKRLGRGFNEREQWRRTQKERLRLTELMGLVPLNLGAPAMDYVKETVFLAKKDNPTYSPKEIYYDILKQSVPLYKFKDVYNNDEISSRFDADELEKLKQKYLRDGVPLYEFFDYMDKLIQSAKEKRAYRAREAEEAQEEEERQQRSLLEKKTKKCPGPKCSILGGKLKNAFRKKNKSKRVNKRFKKNKRYSRKSFKII
jgi:hypothetical protein